MAGSFKGQINMSLCEIVTPRRLLGLFNKRCGARRHSGLPAKRV